MAQGCRARLLSEDMDEILRFLVADARADLPNAEVRLLEGLLQRRQSWTLVAHSILNLDEVLSKR